MGGVHFVGFRLWRRQKEGNQKGERAASSIWTREVPRGLFWLVLLFVLFLLLWSLIL
jgi:zona occludens toxin (predicted ATPase)